MYSAQNRSNRRCCARSVGDGRPRGVRLEDGMKVFVRSVLLGMPERDAFRHNAEPHPPHGQAGQPPQAGAGKGAAVIAGIRSGNPYSANARANCPPRRLEGPTAQARSTARQIG